MNKFFENKPRVLFTFGTLFVLLLTLTSIMAIYLSNNQSQQNILAKVGSENITIDDLKNEVYGKSFSNNDYESATAEEKDLELQYLIEAEIARQEALKLGLSISDSEITEYINDSLGSEVFATYSEDQKNHTKSSIETYLLIQKVKEKQITWFEGTYLAFNYHKYQNTDTEEYITEDMGDEDLIEEQKNQAIALSKEISTNLNNGSITLDEAATLVKNDSIIGEKAMLPRTPTFVREFDKTIPFNNLDVFQGNYFFEQLANISNNKASSPIIQESNGVGYRYLVFYVTNKNEGQYNGYSSWLEGKKNEYNVTEENFASGADPTNSIIPIAQAATETACSICTDKDNTDLFVTLKYLQQTGVPKILTGQEFLFGALSGKTPYTKSTNCSWRTDAVATESDNVGERSLCGINHTFVCADSQDAYIKLPIVTATSSNVNFTNTAASAGRWGWTQQQSRMNPIKELKSSDPTVACSTTDYTFSSTGGMCARLNFAGLNGATIYNTFEWRPHWNTAPTAILKDMSDSVGNNDTFTLPSGTTTQSVKFASQHSDPDGDDGSVKFRWSSNNGTSWSESSYTSLAVNNSIRYHNLNLGVGDYLFQSRAKDEHNAEGSWTSSWSFSITDGSSDGGTDPNMTCDCSPQNGLAPLVVRFDIEGSGVLSSDNFTFFPNWPPPVNIASPPSNDIEYTLIDGSRTIYYTYSESDTYYPRLLGNSSDFSQPIVCCDGEVTVTDPSDSEGGEVAP